MKILTLAAVLSLAVAALHADVIDPREDACRGRRAGDTCGGGGRCVQSTCGRNDYSGGVPPKSIRVSCLLCEGPANPLSVDTAAAGGEARTTAAIGGAVLATGVLFAFLWHRRSNGNRARS
jgi:hypothetical protein